MNLILLAAPLVTVLLAAALGVAFVFRRVVPTNRVDIVQSRSKTTSFGKGRDTGNVYYAWPAFLPLVGVTVTHFPESVFTVQLDNYEAYDLGRLPFMVDIMGFYRIKDSDTAAHRVADFAELHSQLRGVMESTVRSILGNEALEVIMGDRIIMAGQFTAAINASLEEWGVATVKDIAFMDIRDKQGESVIANIMAKEKSRISKESRTIVAQNDQAAQEAEIDAQRQVGIRQQDAAQQVGQRTAEAKKAVGISEQQAQQEVLVEAKTTNDKDMDVKRVQQVRAAEIERDVQVVAADQAKQVTVIEAEAQASQLEKVAVGQLAATKNTAEGIKLTGEAQGRAREAVLQAEVAPQITLAKEIGANDGYQTYLVKIEQVKANQAIGVANAQALSDAEVRVIVTGGSAASGLSNIADLISPQGGAALGAMVEAVVASSDTVAARVTPPKRTRANGVAAEAQ